MVNIFSDVVMGKTDHITRVAKDTGYLDHENIPKIGSILEIFLENQAGECGEQLVFVKFECEKSCLKYVINRKAVSNLYKSDSKRPKILPEKIPKFQYVSQTTAMSKYYVI